MDEEKKPDFISETIVNDAIKEHQRKNLLGAALYGAVFGLAALIVFGCGFAIYQHMTKDSQQEETETTVEETDGLPDNEEELESMITKLIKDNSKASKSADLGEKLALALAKHEESHVTVVAETNGVGMLDDEFSTSEQYSGVVISKNNNGYYILTSAGKLKSADELAVRLYDGDSVSAEFVRQDSALNIALLKISAEDGRSHELDVVRTGKLSGLSQGQTVYWYGSASGKSASLGTGSVSCIDEDIHLSDVLLDCIQVSEGCNAELGSFLYGLDGSLYGVALGEDELPSDYALTEGYGAALGIDQLMHYINRMISGQKTALIGIIGQDVTENMQSSYNMPAGMFITQVQEDTAAYDAGIQEGDVLTSIGNIEITCRKDFSDAIFQLTAGKKITAVIYRENKGEYRKMNVKLKPGKR